MLTYTNEPRVNDISQTEGLLHISILSRYWRRWTASSYHLWQRGHFNFLNVNLPFLINKPYAPWYSVSISQLIHYIPACSIFTAGLCIFKEPNACTQTHYHMHSKSRKTFFYHAFYPIVSVHIFFNKIYFIENKSGIKLICCIVSFRLFSF